MFLRRKFKDMDDNTTQSFKNVASDMDFVLDRIEDVNDRISDTNNELYALRDELATNGVIRDIRQVQRELRALQDDYHRYRQELDSNGVATAIKKLRTEVFGKRKAKKNNDFLAVFRSAYFGEETQPEEEATLAGKVDAIIEHLGLDVTVKPEEVSEAKVVAKRKVTKKKGSR